MRVSVVGLGYVGLVTSGGLAEWGHEVFGIEASRARLQSLRDGQMPFFEPGLSELVTRHTASGRLRFGAADRATTEVAGSDVVMIAVGTDDGHGGWQTDTAMRALASIVPVMSDSAVLVIRSTLPPRFVHELPAIVRELRRGNGRTPIPVMLNPEFTRESQAVDDFLHPDRVVLGTIDDPEQIGTARLQELYAEVEAPILVLDGIDASLSKLGANLFLATKISFANELALLCEAYESNVEHVVRAMAHDTRIGGSFLRAGVGFGGSCLPHQVTMAVKSAAADGLHVPLLEAVETINQRQRHRFVELLIEAIGETVAPKVALLGLAFKPGTDDLREAPSLTIAADLVQRGVRVVAYDPMAGVADRAAELVPGLETARTSTEAVAGADAIGLVTEWPEFVSLDWEAIRPIVRGSTVIDGRNALDAERIVEAGFAYRGFGRGYAPVAPPVAEEPSVPIQVRPLADPVSVAVSTLVPSEALAENFGQAG